MRPNAISRRPDRATSLLFAAGLLATLATSLPAAAATLRSLTRLDQPVVRLSDLFDNAGPNAARVLGPAPSPGASLVVEAPQLAAIAQQFGVDWQPASDADHIELQRPGRSLPRADIMAALRRALDNEGVPQDAEIALPLFAPPLVPANVAVQSDVEQLDYDSITERFTAILAITSDGISPLHLRVAGSIREMILLPVPTRRVLPGETIGASDIRMAHLRANPGDAAMAQLPAQLVGMASRRELPPDLPVNLAALTRPQMVLKGTRVMLHVESGGLAVNALGQALESGGLGDHIHILNPTSRAVVEAEITGPDQLRVDPASIPARPAQSPGMIALGELP